MRIKIYIISLGIFSIAAGSCKKKTDYTTPLNPSPSTGTFSCKVNGTAFTADSASYSSNTIQTFILAYKGGRAKFEINLNGIIAATYTIGVYNDFIYWPTATAYSGGNGGTLVISTYDNSANQVTGSFSNINTDGPGGTFVITEGVFSKIPKRSSDV